MTTIHSGSSEALPNSDLGDIRISFPHWTVPSAWPTRPGLLNPYRVATTQGWHSVTFRGRWDTDGITRDFRSFVTYSKRDSNEEKPKWEEAAFVLNSQLIITLSEYASDCWTLEVWADSPEKAQSELNRLKSQYLLPDKKRDVTEFYVVTTAHGEIEARCVELRPWIFDEGDLELHYGRQFSGWSTRFVERLKARKFGLTILQGSPGTGKTSYLKYLVHSLRHSHRFYYLPVTVYPMLASSSTVDFWHLETVLHEKKQKVVIIEDAETLLMQRAADNQESLSNLLNIADGFLGAFLQMHLICTVNTQIDKLDPAVLRPGRLLARYVFNRLSRAEARTLAAAKGLNIPDREDYSLAEIYNCDEHLTQETAEPIGFRIASREQPKPFRTDPRGKANDKTPIT